MPKYDENKAPIMLINPRSITIGIIGTMAILASGEIIDNCQKLTIMIGRVNTIAARLMARASRNPNHFGRNENNLSKKSPKNRSQNTARNER